MTHINYAVGITSFVIFIVFVLSSGGIENFIGDDELENYNVTEDDLRMSPDIPEAEKTSIDLEQDIEDSENIRVDEDLEDQDFESDNIVSLADPDEDGWVMYQLSGDTVQIETVVTQWGFFEFSGITLEQYETADEETDPIESNSLKSIQTIDIEDRTNFIRFVLESEDSRLYDVEQSNSEELTALGSINAWFSSVSNAVSSWFSIVTGLPSQMLWISIFISIIAVLIVLEIALW